MPPRPGPPPGATGRPASSPSWWPGRERPLRAPRSPSAASPLARVRDEERQDLAVAGELAVIVRDGEVVVAAPDSVGLLYRTAGVLALHARDVRSAAISAHEGVTV